MQCPLLGPAKFAELYQGHIQDPMYVLDYAHTAVKTFTAV